MRGFKVVNFGDVGHGKSTFSSRLLFDIKATAQNEIRPHQAGPSESDWTYFTNSLKEDNNQSPMEVSHKYLYTNNARIHVMDAPGLIDHFGNTLAAILSADHVNLIVDITEKNNERLYFYLKLALKLCEGRATVLINKMDEVNWSEEVYKELCQRIRAHVVDEDQLRVECIPICAPLGDNVYIKSTNLDWYSGDTAYQLWKRSFLSKKRAVKKTNSILTIQNSMPLKDKWAVQGQLFQGRLEKGDFLTTLPGREKVQVEKLFLYDQEVEKAEEGSGVTVVINKPGEGQFLVKDAMDFQVASRLTSRIFTWGPGFQPKESYLLKYFGKTYQCQIDTVHSQNKVLDHVRECVVDLELSPNLTYQRLDHNSKLGTFSLLDQKSYRSMALGLL